MDISGEQELAVSQFCKLVSRYVLSMDVRQIFWTRAISLFSQCRDAFVVVVVVVDIVAPETFQFHFLSLSNVRRVSRTLSIFDTLSWFFTRLI